jgi:hypothetical protein
LGAVLQLGGGTWRCWDENNRTQLNKTRSGKYLPSLTNIFDSGWNEKLLRLGNYRLWVDNQGRLRVKQGEPMHDGDGQIVGTQS